MSKEALFVGWGQVVRGREQLALKVFEETVAYFEQMRQGGRVDSFESFTLAPHGGDLSGFILLHGEQSGLDSMRCSPEFLRVLARAGAVVDNLGVVSAHTGDSLAQIFSMFGEVAQELPQAR
jgi:hypothetical protein